MDELTPLGEVNGSEGGTESSGRVGENGVILDKIFLFAIFLVLLIFF